MALENAREIFEVHMPERFQRKPELAETINAVYKFVLTGDGGGTWLVDLTQPGGKITEADGDAKCTLTVEASDFLDIVTGKLNGQMAFMSGKLKVAGDMAQAMKLGSILSG